MNAEEEQVGLFGLDGSHGKTFQGHSAQGSPKGRTSASSSRRSSELKAIPYMSLDLTPGHGNLLGESYWEMNSPWRGGSLMLNTGPAPLKEEDVFSLSQILQDDPPRKYYLSRTACLGILRRSAQRGKDLPEQLKVALMAQAGLTAQTSSPELKAYHINQRDEGIDLHGVAGALMATSNMQMQTFVTQAPIAFAANQRDEVRDLHGVAGALGAQPGMKQQTFIAAFNAGAGPSASTIGWQEECAPTLKGSPSGNMMPAVLCLNDQGGSVMDCSEDVAGTLRAQEHGHQPLVLYENHGKDARYKGPLKVAPTVVTAYGSGGNNIPLVGKEMFSRQRVDKFKLDDVASTESARQHRDATDLVYQKTVGALTSSDSKGPNSQYVGQDKLVLEGPLLIRRLTPLECERLQGLCDTKENAKLFGKTAKIGTNSQNNFA